MDAFEPGVAVLPKRAVQLDISTSSTQRFLFLGYRRAFKAESRSSLQATSMQYATRVFKLDTSLSELTRVVMSNSAQVLRFGKDCYVD